jgi:3-(3-hydroxy-phenyl)propionate hydroxylase
VGDKVNSNVIYDVLIIGLGPVGATLASLLGQNGHRVAVAEMHTEIYDKPRAINIDQEALRLWQRIGVASAVSEGCALHPGSDFLGVDGELIKAIYSAPPPYPMGWPANLMFVQPKAEKLLRERIAKLDSVDVFLQYTAVAFKQSTEAVSVTFDTPAGKTTLQARYLIGSDGANSPTRQWMKAPLTDLGFSEHYVVVDAWITRDTPLPPRTTQYCRPDAPTSYVVCSDNLRRWELKILPSENISDYDDLENIKKRLAPFVDVDVLKFWRSAVYHFNARVADTWRSGRVFLAGDAAHTMPPFLAQGLNSGLRDAANLAWKLSYVLQNRGTEELLDSYQTERRPHILALTEIAKELGQIVGETNHAKALERDKQLRKEMEVSGPVTVRQSLIPTLYGGFLDTLGGELAGGMAPQPQVVRDNTTYLLDDLLSGFSMVKFTRADNRLEVTNDVETNIPSSFSCHDTELLFAGLMLEETTAIIIRPDGVIWSADSRDLNSTIKRLHSAFKQPAMG